MKHIKDYFEEYDKAFTESLINVNFSSDEVVKFLPEAISVIIDSSNKTSIYQTINILLSNRPRLLLKNMNVPMIASRSEMSHFQVATGLQAIAHTLLQTYSEATFH